MSTEVSPSVGAALVDVGRRPVPAGGSDRRRREPVAALADPEVAGLQAPTYLGQRPRRRGTTLAFRIVVPLALLFIWWLGTDIGFISKQILASPTKVVEAAHQLIQTGQLWQYLEASLRREALGVSLGVSVGLTFGICSGLARLGEDLIDPMMQVLRAVPFLALVPLFIAWFGVGETFKVVLIAVATAGPMYAYTYTGVRNVDRKVVEAARGFGLRGSRLVLDVIIPSALPNLLMALRVSMGISLTGLIAAEQIGTTNGIGYLVYLSQEYFRNDYMVLCILLYAILGLLIDGVMRVIERLTMPWRRYQTVR
jgi:sulfonate transport system permease protein